MKNILTNEYIIMVILCINVLLFILYFINYFKFKKYKEKNELLIRKLGNGKDIIELINKNNEQIEEIKIENSEIRSYINRITDDINKNLQKVGFIRYNAFEDKGNNLSFVLVILDNNNNGIIINGVYSRNGSNIYAKSVKNGIAEYRLSQEEEIALKEAIEKYN